MKLIVFSATMAMVLAILFSAACGDEKENSPVETQEVQETDDAQDVQDVQDVQEVEDVEGDSADPVEEPAGDTSSDGGDAGEISLKFNPHEEMLAYTLKTEMIVMEPMVFRAGVKRTN